MAHRPKQLLRYARTFLLLVAGTLGFAACQQTQSAKAEDATERPCKRVGGLIGEELTVCTLKRDLRSVRAQLRLVKSFHRDRTPPQDTNSGTKGLCQRNNELAEELQDLGQLATKFPGCEDKNF